MYRHIYRPASRASPPHHAVGHVSLPDNQTKDPLRLVPPPGLTPLSILMKCQHPICLLRSCHGSAALPFVSFAPSGACRCPRSLARARARARPLLSFSSLMPPYRRAVLRSAGAQSLRTGGDRGGGGGRKRIAACCGTLGPRASGGGSRAAVERGRVASANLGGRGRGACDTGELQVGPAEEADLPHPQGRHAGPGETCGTDSCFWGGDKAVTRRWWWRRRRAPLAAKEAVRARAYRPTPPTVETAVPTAPTVAAPPLRTEVPAKATSATPPSSHFHSNAATAADAASSAPPA